MGSIHLFFLELGMLTALIVTIKIGMFLFGKDEDKYEDRERRE